MFIKLRKLNIPSDSTKKDLLNVPPLRAPVNIVVHKKNPNKVSRK